MKRKLSYQKKENKDFQSSKLLLDTAKDEYNLDISKLESLYSRVNGMLALMIAILGYVLTKNEYFTLFQSSSFKTINCTENLLLNCLYIFTIVAGVASLVFYIICLATKQYTRLDISIGFNNEVTHASEAQTAFHLMEQYRNIVNSNKTPIDNKFSKYNYGIISTLTTILLFILYNVLSMIFLMT